MKKEKILKMSKQKKCLCKKCELKNTSDCPTKQLERFCIERGRKDQTENPQIIMGGDGFEYIWDGPMAMFKPIRRI